MIARKDVNRRVVVAAAALATGAALVLTGCGAGQLSQTASQVAAVNGNAATVGSIDLRNVRILAPEGEYTNKTGGTALLAFSAANQSASETIKLEKITTDVASSVKLEATEIKPQTAIVAAKPGEEDPLELDYLTVVLEGLKEDLVEGPTYALTFEFSDGTKITLDVPIDSEGQPRWSGETESADAGHGSESGGGEEVGESAVPPAAEAPALNPSPSTAPAP